MNGENNNKQNTKTDTIKATFFTSKPFLQNRQFDISDNVRDNCLFMFYTLKKKFEEYNIILSTQDVNPSEESTFIIYNDMPKIININNDKQNYLLLIESKIIRPDNWNLNNHKYFNKIFTWDDDLIDNKKYFKINYSHKIPKEINVNMINKNKLITMISAHKYQKCKLELYTERVKAIRWFEQNYPEDFDLYGFGWDRYYFKSPLSKLNRSTKLTKIMKPNYPSYKGEVRSKKIIFEKYKFAICYENVKDIKGYITEKIFDCLFSGCVPIYLGAQNITDYVPSNTFIDKRDFSDYRSLYNFIKSMSNEMYLDYIKNINDFIKSDKICPFSAEYFAETIVSEIMA